MDLHDSSSIDDSLEHHGLIGTKGSEQPRIAYRQNRGLRRLIAFQASVLGILVAFLGGMAFERMRVSKSSMRNFDDLVVVPDKIKALLETDVGLSFGETTTSPLAFGDHPPIWHQPPSPAVDAWWKRFGPQAVFLITAEEMRRMGKDPETRVHIPKDFGYGDKVYLTKLDHLHQIHCLDILRKMAHHEYYNYTSPNNVLHADHCVRTLYDYLSCHVSWDTFNYIWVQGEARPQPDFTSRRQCREMDPMWEFYTQNSVHMDERILYLMPTEDARWLPQDPSFLPYLELAFKEHPDIPSPEAERAERSRKYEEAMRKWKSTGHVPMNGQ